VRLGGDAEVGQHHGDRRVDVDLALLDELHREHAREQLRDGGDAVRRVRAGRVLPSGEVVP
jgi:hypothetical protein